MEKQSAKLLQILKKYSLKKFSSRLTLVLVLSLLQSSVCLSAQPEKKEPSDPPALKCKVEYASGSFDAYARPIKQGDAITLDMKELRKKTTQMMNFEAPVKEVGPLYIPILGSLKLVTESRGAYRYKAYYGDDPKSSMSWTIDFHRQRELPNEPWLVYITYEREGVSRAIAVLNGKSE
jgi:hypothetical protein